MLLVVKATHQNQIEVKNDIGKTGTWEMFSFQDLKYTQKGSLGKRKEIVSSLTLH
jgi:hypothetical protein